YLNSKKEYEGLGKWKRQDPGFPDAIFEGKVDPPPGFEIKAWFPLSTEITARFRDSQNSFSKNNIYVAMLAWLPDKLIYGKPYILDVCVVSGLSVAEDRDNHYHNPPDYLVLEPLDTQSRTKNLQQTNTSGHKWQGSIKDFKEAQKIVEGWGNDGKNYKPTPEYQKRLRELTSRYSYRLDTNFAKMDRIVHEDIENFKSKVLSTVVFDKTIREWNRLFSNESKTEIGEIFEEKFSIRRVSSDESQILPARRHNKNK
ncbi:MAG: hypothetical protein KAR20_24355, partial [Candidatus Heimdallarchaeota archaeon]|nr:hypothetical protein [Candidatus Heimdallarchaeota archaeon]